MTMQEAGERYRIPMFVLREYESWGFGGADSPCSDTDLARLSILLTLHDIGFSAAEVEVYLRLALQGASTAGRRLFLLEKRRSAVLEQIHAMERQLQRLDYLRHELRQAGFVDKRGPGGL